MKYKIKAVLPFFVLCMLLSACAQPLVTETQPSLSVPTETPLSSLMPTSVLTESPALQPLPTPEPLPEGSPLTLAGQVLDSAVMTEEEETYPFSYGTVANLEGWFQLLGFRAEEPFYEYYDPDGTLRLILWYAPESGAGLGIRYRGPYAYGFGFRSTGWATRQGAGEESYSDCLDWDYGWYRWEDDPFTLPQYDISGVPDYEERREWDEAGRLTSLASYGTLEYWPPVKEKPLPLREFTYDYDEEGNLRHRRVFSHNTFQTTNPGQDGYYDDQGRLVYEYGYITHGSTDTYYIYEGESPKPSYALYLDDNLGADFPAFVRYQ